VFDDDRLALAAELHLRWHDREGAIRLHNELIEKYPESDAADKAREWVAEEERASELE
jgi:hypothetical protein